MSRRRFISAPPFLPPHGMGMPAGPPPMPPLPRQMPQMPYPQGGFSPQGQGAAAPAGQGGASPSGLGSQYPAGQTAPYPAMQGSQYPAGQAAQYPAIQGAPYPGGPAPQFSIAQGPHYPAGQTPAAATNVMPSGYTSPLWPGQSGLPMAGPALDPVALLTLLAQSQAGTAAPGALPGLWSGGLVPLGPSL